MIVAQVAHTAAQQHCNTRFEKRLFCCEDAAQQVLMSACVSASFYNIQNVPECSRMFLSACRMLQNVPECLQNVPECLQNVPECMQNVPECSRMHAECSRMFQKSLHGVSWACMQFLSWSEQLTRISQCLFGFDRSPRRGNVMCVILCNLGF